VSEELEEVRARLDRFKNQGGPAIEAHEHSANHRPQLEASNLAGCFFCCATYSPSQIEEWVDDETTALCPKCGIDAVIGGASGFPIGDGKFLKEMNGIWFS